jgi:hypothetical protein
MKRQIKKCKGFDVDLCKKCKRQDDKAKLLVSTLNKKDNRYYCVHFR